MPNFVEFEFDGDKYECDADACNSYKVAKGLAMAAAAPDRFFQAAELIFRGKDEEYADKVGSTEAFGKLLNAAMEAVGAKNS